MRKAVATLLACLFGLFLPLLQGQEGVSNGYFSPEQLDNLLAPVALYPDPLLAQVLLAATFPDQIDEAARFVRANPDPNAIDPQPWDVSVKSVAHYPTVLFMMADKLDWTTALGQAYASQSTDVMASVQHLRAEARNVGNLQSTPQQQVVVQGSDIEIWPAQPQYIYVPTYDPAIVYFSRGAFFAGAAISFSAGFLIGAWLNHYPDWHTHGIVYMDWGHPYGWFAGARPFVRVTNVYVNNSYRNVFVNREVINRQVNYATLNRYSTVHRNVTFNNVRVSNANVRAPGAVPAWGAQNKIIERNMNTGDPRLNAYRGQPQVAPQPARQAPQSQGNRPNYQPPQQSRPAYQAPQQNAAFGGNRGNFDARQTSQRGQASRAAASQSHSGGGGQQHGGGGGHEEHGEKR